MAVDRDRKGGGLTTFFRGCRRFCGGRVFDRVGAETEPCWVGGESGIAGRQVKRYIKRHDRAMIPPDFTYGALSGQIFYSTQIPVGHWFIGENGTGGKSRAASEFELSRAA